MYYAKENTKLVSFSSYCTKNSLVEYSIYSAVFLLQLKWSSLRSEVQIIFIILHNSSGG